MVDLILDTILDNLKLLPFLFLTYLIMEWVEHKTGNFTQKLVKRSGNFGALIGAVAGVFPQCGFSAAGSGLYAGRVITLGTLFSIFLSTSDEMLPVMLSEKAPFPLIGQILFLKVLIGLAAGLFIDGVMRMRGRKQELKLHELCDHDHCHCEQGIVKSALHHTVQVAIFILAISFVLNCLIAWIGESAIESLFVDHGIIGCLTAGLIGLIPNCAASVMITELYLRGVLPFGVMMSGLLTGSGVGILVLFRVNHNLRENVKIVGGLYAIGVMCGILLEMIF